MAATVVALYLLRAPDSASSIKPTLGPQVRPGRHAWLSIGSMATFHPRHAGVSERLRQHRFQLDRFPAA
jgi:hypothetical protein